VNLAALLHARCAKKNAGLYVCVNLLWCVNKFLAAAILASLSFSFFLAIFLLSFCSELRSSVAMGLIVF